jgi:hypothetical protein
MDYKKWIDSVIKAHKEIVMLDETSDEYVGICLGSMEWLGKVQIQLSGKLENVAEAVGTKVLIRDHDGEYDRYYFDYDDCEIFTLRRKQ